VGRYRNLFIESLQQQASGTLSEASGPADEHQSSILRSGVLMAAGLLVLVLIAESMGA
jgi:Ca2+:H+ antiporter